MTSPSKKPRAVPRYIKTLTWCVGGGFTIFLTLMVGLPLYFKSTPPAKEKVWEMVSAIGQWGGAMAQAFIAALALIVAVIAYRENASYMKMQYLKQVNDSFNEWTRFIADSKKRTKIATELESPTRGSFDADSVTFFYLNILNNIMIAEDNNAIDEEAARAVYEDFGRSVRSMPEEELNSLLKRGYSDRFQNKVLSFCSKDKPDISSTKEQDNSQLKTIETLLKGIDERLRAIEARF